MRSHALAVLLLLASGTLGALGAAREESRPNLVFLLTDDQHWETLGAAGNPIIQTPHLDRLAAQGMNFRQAFVTTSICSVSRASILSGQYARQHGIRDFDQPFLKHALSLTYPALLRRAGYYTGFIGKWGVGSKRTAHLDAASAIFDDWAGFSRQGDYWHERRCQLVTHAGVDGFRGSQCDCEHAGADGPATEKLLHLTTQIIPGQVARFLENRDPEAPFCLSISFKAPHDPVEEVPPGRPGLYEGVELPVPATATVEGAAGVPGFLSGSLEFDKGRAMIEDQDPDSAFQEYLRNYYRMVTGIDDVVGQVRELLAAHDLSENTVIVFTSDNGLMLGAHGLWGKWLMYEESIRVPMLILDPRLPADRRGAICDEMVLNIDLAPTLLELAGVSPPEQMQGQSIAPLLTAPEAPFRESWLYEHHFNPGGARSIERSEGLRTRTLKYIRYIDQEPPYEELFDLVADPGELHDLSGLEQHRGVLEQLRADYFSFCSDLEVR